MPELPEVETIKNQLQKTITGKKIKAVEIFLPKIVKAPLVEFKKVANCAIVKSVSRRAKLLIFELNSGWTMLIHLKMTGQLIYQQTVNNKQLTVNKKHTHIIFKFTDGTNLLFNDLRQFGYIKLIKTADLGQFFLAEKIGPEPLAKNFVLADFAKILSHKPNAKIKQWLMDPQNIAGIGNIYADEILYVARIQPLRKNSSLNKTEVKKIFQAIKKILPQAIKSRGTSANDYLDAFGQPGNYFKKLKVYGREDQPCLGCHGRIKRIKIGGRSAHFCPVCQR